MDLDYEQRVARAVELFKMGYNCAQAVTAAFADEYGYTEEQALKMSASFGGGIGRMRETCGAACGMFILAGLDTGSVDACDRQGKADNYALVQQLADEFRRENGSLICAELLGLRERRPQVPVPDERTAVYYEKRPCAKMVETAACIWSKYKKNQQKSEKKQ
jgi:C_GCAxxG_C_C family probable redox protein